MKAPLIREAKAGSGYPLTPGPPILRIPRARAKIRKANDSAKMRVIVLDDDPTGSQSVHGIPVLTRWSDDDVVWAFNNPTAGFFILTNTRAMNSVTAAALVSEVVTVIERVSERLHVPYVLISRSDSTLRGHYPLETDVLFEKAAQRGAPYDALLIAPAYFAAGRITVGDVHYARVGEQFIPVGQTTYANDATFGFSSSDLRNYIEEKTSGAVPAGSVVSLSLEDIRVGGVKRVRDVILSCTNGTPIVVNAAVDSDLDVVVLGLIEAESAGARVVSRTGPSFVAARLGMTPQPPIDRTVIFKSGERTGNGVVVVGSHVELTTLQVTRLIDEVPDISIVELDVGKLLNPESAYTEAERCAAELANSVHRSTTLLMTSRNRVDGIDGDDSLGIAQTVSRTLSALVGHLVASTPVAWMIAKGGITSSDIATEGLGIRRAMVLGQLFPGIVSVWLNQGDESDNLRGLPLVVFAGNVGDEDTLKQTVQILRGPVVLSGA
jgi:uncharacterized protein YgbK (DUF1537 family)